MVLDKLQDIAQKVLLIDWNERKQTILLITIMRLALIVFPILILNNLLPAEKRMIVHHALLMMVFHLLLDTAQRQLQIE